MRPSHLHAAPVLLVDTFARVHGAWATYLHAAAVLRVDAPRAAPLLRVPHLLFIFSILKPVI